MEKKPRVYQQTTPELANVWDEYIGWNEDLIIVDFLANIIKCIKKIPQEIYVLDAAAATGRATIFLASKGYRVYENTTDFNLNKKLDENVRNKQEGTEIQISDYDWALISYYFKHQKFDTVILIGNFLSRLLDENERRRVIEQCFKILKPGGIFIVDKRNFDRILKLKDADIYSYDGFYDNCYRCKVLYRGETVRGWPKLIDDNLIEFVIGSNKKEFDPIFKMYPFKSNTGSKKNQYHELKNLLMSCHFEKVEIYQDYDFNNKIPEDKYNYSDLESDFIVYVAFKNHIMNTS